MSRNKVVVAKRRASAKMVLKYISDNLEILFPHTRKNLMRLKYANIPDWEDYLPATVYLAADRLERRGLVEKISTSEGITVKITDKGKKQTLKYDLLKLSQPKGKWDGQWRLVFFRHFRNTSEEERCLADLFAKFGDGTNAGECVCESV